MLRRSFVAISTLALAGSTLPWVLGGRDGQGPVSAARADSVRPPAAQRSTELQIPATGSTELSSGQTPRCQPTAHPIGYVNPLAGARVTPERIDQGVDYAGSGTLAAIGAAQITYVAISGTGWPGAFIEYRLLDGPNRGCHVYYAEGVVPAGRLHVGEQVQAGHAIARIIPGYSSGIEVGWGAGRSTKTYAAQLGQWSPGHDADSIPSKAGRSFSALIASLGGPAGKVEG